MQSARISSLELACVTHYGMFATKTVRAALGGMTRRREGEMSYKAGD